MIPSADGNGAEAEKDEGEGAEAEMLLPLPPKLAIHALTRERRPRN
jgi:hypothetical protein